MNPIGNEAYFEMVRRNLLPPHPVSRLVKYDYCALGGVGLREIESFGTRPIVQLTMFATPSTESPLIFDIKHAHPWPESDEEMTDILRRMVSLKLRTADRRTCADRVIEGEHARMMDSKLPFAMLAGWGDDRVGDTPSAVTITYNTVIGARRSLAVFNAILRDMVIGESDRMFSNVLSNLDTHISVAPFPTSAHGLGVLSIPMD